MSQRTAHWMIQADKTLTGIQDRRACLYKIDPAKDGSDLQDCYY
jgi:hypothetical protein